MQLLERDTTNPKLSLCLSGPSNDVMRPQCGRIKKRPVTQRVMFNAAITTGNLIRNNMKNSLQLTTTISRAPCDTGGL